jgi:hypothetical protein
MRPLQPSKHGGQLEAERDDDPTASTQSLNSNGYSHSRPRFSKRIRDLALLGRYRELIQASPALFQGQRELRDGAASTRALSCLMASEAHQRGGLPEVLGSRFSAGED